MTFNPITLRARLMLSPDGVESGGTTLNPVGAEITETAASPSGNAAIPDITVLSDNSYILLWHEDSNTGQYSSKWQRFDASGTAITPVNTFEGNANTVSALANGGFAISYSVWQDMRVQRFDSASSAVGDPVIADSTPYNNGPTVTGLPDGGFVMTWAGYPASGMGYGNVLCRRYDANGVAQGDAQQVNAETEGSLGTAVTALADGGFIISWLPQSYDLTWGRGVAMRRYDASGQPVNSTEIAVAPTATSDPYFDVTALVDGGWVVSWSSDKDDIRDVYAQVYNADGTVRGTEIHMALPDYQASAHVTGLSDGGFMMAWSGRGPAGGGDTDIFGQRFSASGAAVGDTIVLNDTLSGSQSGPVLAARSDGGFVVAWQTDGTYDFMNPSSGMTPTGGSVSVRAFDVSTGGTGPTDPTDPTDPTGPTDPTPEPVPAVNASNPDVTVLSDGGYVLLWDERDASSSSSKWQRFDATGTAVTPVNTIEGHAKAVSALANGGFAISYATWQDIRVQRFDSASSAVGDPITIDPSSYNGFPTVTGLPDGGFLVTWTGYPVAGVWEDGVLCRRYDANGVAQGDAQQVNTEAYGNQGAPAITVLADGGYVIAWRTQCQDATWSYGVAMRRYDASGQPVNGSEIAVSPTTAQEFDPDVTALADGGWVVSWSSDKDDGQDVYAQVYNADGTARGTEIHMALPGYQFSAHVAALSDGGFMLAWSGSNPGGDSDIFGQRFSANGAAVGDTVVLNDALGGNQSSPVLAARSNGGFVVAWQTDGTYTYDPSNPSSGMTPTGGTVSVRAFDGSSDNQVQSLVSAMASFVPAPLGQSTLSDTPPDQMQPIIAASLT